MNNQNKTSLKKILKKSKNISLPLKNIVEQDLEETKLEMPHIKMITIAELQTNCYPIENFYKPISRTLNIENNYEK